MSQITEKQVKELIKDNFIELQSGTIKHLESAISWKNAVIGLMLIIGAFGSWVYYQNTSHIKRVHIDNMNKQAEIFEGKLNEMIRIKTDK